MGFNSGVKGLIYFQFPYRQPPLHRSQLQRNFSFITLFHRNPLGYSGLPYIRFLRKSLIVNLYRVYLFWKRAVHNG